MLSGLLLLLQAVASVPVSSADTLSLHSIPLPPPADGRIDSLAWGRPQVTIPTRQGDASIWLLRAGDSVFVAAAIPDRSRAWDDDLAVCFDAAGGRASVPAHEDFLWSFRRTLDSSVVYRGRAGRWSPPLDDPDWRLGAARAGGGWEVSGSDGEGGWTVVLRLDPAWLDGEAGRRPTIAFRIHDGDPNAWYPWPPQETNAGATLVERTPALWVPVR